MLKLFTFIAINYIINIVINLKFGVYVIYNPASLL